MSAEPFMCRDLAVRLGILYANYCNAAWGHQCLHAELKAIVIRRQALLEQEQTLASALIIAHQYAHIGMAA